jgi:hypothetical protein
MTPKQIADVNSDTAYVHNDLDTQNLEVCELPKIINSTSATTKPQDKYVCNTTTAKYIKLVSADEDLDFINKNRPAGTGLKIVPGCILPKGVYTDNCYNGIPSLTFPNVASSNNAQVMTFDDNDDNIVPNTENYSIKLQVNDPKLPPAHKEIYAEYVAPKIKFQLCPTPNHIYTLDETKAFSARCMSWNCPACSPIMKLRQYIRLTRKIDDKGTEGLKVIAFTLGRLHDDEGYWIEIGKKFSYMRRRINSKRKCSHCPNTIRYPEGYNGKKNPKDGFCFEATKDGICRYSIPEYYWVREIQMQRLEKYGVAARHLHMLGWFGYIPWRLIKHYWPHGDFKIQALNWKDAEKAAGYMIQYLNKEKEQRLFFKGERRYGNSRGFFEGLDKAGNRLPEIVQEWKDFLIPFSYNPNEIWIVKTYWATPLHIVMLVLRLECAKDNPQTKLV